MGRARVYTKADRTRLKLTLRGKRLGLSLAEIRELLDMYGGVRNSAPQLQRFLTALAVRRAAMEQQRRDIQALLQDTDILEHQSEPFRGDNAEGAAAARAELVRRIDRASVG